MGLDCNGEKISFNALSGREFEIFKQLALGVSIAYIAAKLDLSGSTVSTYRNLLLKKLQLKSTTELIR